MTRVDVDSLYAVVRLGVSAVEYAKHLRKLLRERGIAPKEGRRSWSPAVKERVSGWLKYSWRIYYVEHGTKWPPRARAPGFNYRGSMERVPR